MSGIEVAGLVLGAIPLLIMAVQQYAEGVSTIKRYLRYERPLKDITRSLTTEYEIFRNTCEQLLDDLVRDNEMQELLKEPSGKAWKDPVLKRKVESRLQKSFDGYMKTMEDLSEAVEEFKGLLKLDASGKPHFTGTSSFKQEYQRLKFSLKKSDYDGLIKRIRRNNATLATLTKQTLYLEPVRARRSHGAPNFKAIQQYAINLYEALGSGFQCVCWSHHSINLRLECHKDCRSSSYDDEELEKDPRFRVIFTPSQGLHLPADIQIIKAKTGPQCLTGRVRFSASTMPAPNQASPQQPIAMPIKNLCMEIMKLKEPYQGSCLGTLGGYFNVVQPATFDPAPGSSSLLTLERILSSPNDAMGRRFYRKDGLRIAIVLASSLLQLHKTPWIHDNWKISDIYFLEGPDGDLLNKPFVNRACRKDNHSSSQPATTRLGVRNLPLFTLGIMLIELCLKAPFEVLRQRYQSTSAICGTGDSDFAIADRLVDEVYMESFRYGEAVRRCIRCDFDKRTTSLDDESFRGAVYDGVVSLLEEDFKVGFT